MSETPTAGFRNAAWTMTSLTQGAQVSVFPLTTADKAATNGFLYSNGDSDTVFCIMHPREFLATHYLIPEILAGGAAVWTQTPRSVGSDLRLEHEIALFDVAAGLTHLRGAGFRRIVLLGNSGGASLYAFYNEQSLLDPERRLTHTPGGRPTNLAKLEMPVASGIVLVSPHPGQGVILQNCIDPSVTNEADALSVDPSLDPLSPENGFKSGPQGSRYAPDFVDRYRVAQRRRVERLDATARDLIVHRMSAKKRGKESGTRADLLAASHTPVMTIWRTDADLRCWDLSLDPSDRKLGSVWGSDPFAANYGVVGFGRFCTPEAWLSTWSSISSRANLFNTAAAIEQPVLQIEYTADNTVFPADAARVFETIRTRDKKRARLRGDHHGRAINEGDPPARLAAGELIREWLSDTVRRAAAE
jgi:hypothetical protein